MDDRLGTTSVVALDAVAIRARRAAFEALLADAIESNASVGYILPYERERLRCFWDGVANEVEAGERLVFVHREGDDIVGSVQLALCSKPNQPHRADVQKLLVLRSHRRRGIGAALMRALEAHAREAGRWLLLLDTRAGSEADTLYRRWGWQTLGVVPRFALDPDGTMADCTFYWKHLA